MPAVKITNKPVSTPGDQTHFLVTQPELPEGYAPTGQETEEELAELKVESLREIEMDDMVELFQSKFAFDSEPTAESGKPVTSAGIKTALDSVDSEIGELKENLTDLQEVSDTKAAAIYETVSGEIASFSDGADDMPMKSCVVKMEPIQEGSGDPSPENVRPISGRTGLSTWRTGKNLCPVYDRSAGTLWGTNYAELTNFLNTLEVGTYSLKNKYRIEELPTNSENVMHAYIFIRAYANGQYVYLNSYRPITDNSPSVGKTYQESTIFTITEETKGHITDSNLYCDSEVHTGSGRGKFYLYDIFIEKGSSDVDYEPYKGSTYSVNWETEAGTVYGGTLDVVSGKLTVLGVKDTVTVVDGRLQSQFFSEASTGQTVTVLGDNVRTFLNRRSQTSNMNVTSSSYNAKMANLCPHYFSYAADTAHWYVNNQLYLYLPKADVGETLESYKTFLQDNPFEVYIPFATPTEIQLTPQEVRTLLGENNIWSDGGDAEVTYPADTKMYIDTKIAEAVAAAMA